MVQKRQEPAQERLIMNPDGAPKISENSRRIARNTLALYFRMLVLLAIGLYTSRVVLHSLGETDLGVYTTVGGFVALFAVISNSLSAAISRFLTFELGKGDQDRLRRIFSTAVVIQALIAAGIIFLAELAGPWYISRYMTIPPDRVHAAKVVFQFSVLTFAVNLVSVPYNASIIAHEKMTAFAYMGIFEGLCKLAIALLISVAPMDSLVFYALAMCLVAVAVRVVYQVYCRRNFRECRGKMAFDRSLLREMSGFAGWNFIGAASGVLRDHGGTLVINLFFPAAVNAARALAIQVNGAVSQFATSFMTSMNPQITKSYASGDRKYMMSLAFRGSRFSLYLLMMLSFPILFNTPYLMDLWQVDVPDHSVRFVQLVLVLTMVEAVSAPLVTMMLATGDIKKYQIIVGGLQLLNVPLAWIALKLGGAPELVYVVAIALSVACLAARMILLRGMVGLDTRAFCVQVLGNIALVAAVSIPLPLVLSKVLGESFLNMLLICTVSVLCTGAAVWTLGLGRQERDFIKAKAFEKLGISKDGQRS